jgi:hypothetical protein
MGQTAVHIHEDDGTQSRQEHKRWAMDAECHIQLVSENDESSAETTSECSDDGDEIDESVAEDMRKLEESFKGISQKYRLINRIGEGKHTLQGCVPITDHLRHFFDSLQS